MTADWASWSPDTVNNIIIIPTRSLLSALLSKLRPEHCHIKSHYVWVMRMKCEKKKKKVQMHKHKICVRPACVRPCNSGQTKGMNPQQKYHTLNRRQQNLLWIVTCFCFWLFQEIRTANHNLSGITGNILSRIRMNMQWNIRQHTKENLE